ncbi:MAG: DUF2190 family protein [Paracoccus sp. (in: a-proteobacteria)]|nr:DUF2190 family protein [Paracoccus sp. (in: a-proteobacteria)]
MKNFIAIGNNLTVPLDDIAMGEGVIAGNGYLVGALFGVAAASVEYVAGAECVLNLTGVYDLPKQPSQAWTVGAKVYWDATNDRATTTATGNTLIGVATLKTGGTAGETIGRVRLNGGAV